MLNWYSVWKLIKCHENPGKTPDLPHYPGMEEWEEELGNHSYRLAGWDLNEWWGKCREWRGLHNSRAEGLGGARLELPFISTTWTCPLEWIWLGIDNEYRWCSKGGDSLVSAESSEITVNLHLGLELYLTSTESQHSGLLISFKLSVTKPRSLESVSAAGFPL